MQKRRLGVFEFLCNISGEAEIRVLVYGAGDEARNIGNGAKDLRERV